MSSPPTEDELSRDFLTMKRKSAFRQKKIMVIRGHEFVLHFFKEPTYCGHCRQFVWFVPCHS
jgi:thiol-disulfide isomerase/thioredoxin